MVHRKIRGAVIVLLGGLLLPTATENVHAQAVEWIVRDAPVEVGRPDVPLVEPHLTADPRDADHLLVGAIVAGAERPPWHCAAMASFDGGESWVRTDFRDMQRCIDPWVVTLRGDTALFAGVEIVSDAEGPDRFRLYVRRSTDGGRSWSPEPDTLGRRFEHPILVPASAGSGSTLYAAALRFTPASGEEPGREGWVGRLEGPGRTVARTTAMLPVADGLMVTGLAPLSDGTLVVLYRDFHSPDGDDAAPSARGWAVRSRDGGRSFGVPRLVDDGCASGRIAEAFPGYPTATVDRTDESDRDRIYHACVGIGLAGVSFSRSEDGGRHWSEAARVDRAGGAPGTPHARTPMLAAGGGAVAVAWYDRRHDPEAACQHVYLTVSHDGGQTFVRPVRVTTRASCPGTEGNGGVAESWPMGGDYGALSAGPDEAFHLVWADARSGIFRLRRSTFRVRPD